MTGEDESAVVWVPRLRCWGDPVTGSFCMEKGVEVPPGLKMPMCAEHAVQYRQARGYEVPESLIQKARLEK